MKDYPQKVVIEQIYKVVFRNNQLKDLGKLIKNLQLFFYRDSEVRRVFSSVPKVSYRSGMKIKSYTVR